MNLSYPKGQSLNDHVDKLNFDGRPFTLKCSSVDDIEECILQVEDPLIFKTDIARAFRNLKVDPVDALKFGLTWNDALYHQRRHRVWLDAWVRSISDGG